MLTLYHLAIFVIIWREVWKVYIDLILRNKSRFADMIFTYKVPDNMEEKIMVGHRVSLPFGKSNKPTEAFVVRKRDRLGQDDIEPDKIKVIFEILDVEPMLSKENIRLIAWIRNRYMCTYMDALNLFYPKGYKLEAKKVEEDGQVIWTYTDKKNEKKISYLSLKYGLEEIDQMISENKYRLGLKQEEIIKFLSSNESVEYKTLMEILGVSSQSIKSLVDKDFLNVEELDYYRKSDSKFKIYSKEVSLNKDQLYVVDHIKKDFPLENKKPFLLHGVTGSGKTEVYMELIEYSLNQGLDSILLVPEIALTPQMISRVKARFGEIVGVFHSGLSEGQKHDVYREIKNGNIRVIIGTRSAIFLPFRSLGLIIIDEEHDMSYNSEMTPKYSTIEVARYMSLKHHVTLLMGSATPSVSDYYRAQEGEYTLLELNKRANERAMPDIKIVDMKDEMNRGSRSEISKSLEDEIVKTVESGNQAILFLNRRGYASFVTCRECGHVIKCKNCDISLTYHKFKNKGVCHYCGHEELIPDTCPQCSSTNIGALGLGTEKIEEYINKKYPSIRTLRIDKDTTSRKGQLESILSQFNRQDADVLIGTQILSKGHDFENVTLVGIISADMMLNYPDFRSFEQTYQLITQVAGRAGRGQKKGHVILQTYNVDHFAIRHAVNYDYKSFYQDEIRLRRAFGYEPFNNMFRIVFSGKNYNIVKNNAAKFIETVKYLLESQSIEVKGILGPNECSINRINDRYRWQVIIKDEVMDIRRIKSMLRYICISKFDQIFDKNVNINIEINPNSFI